MHVGCVNQHSKHFRQHKRFRRHNMAASAAAAADTMCGQLHNAHWDDQTLNLGLQQRLALCVLTVRSDCGLACHTRNVADGEGHIGCACGGVPSFQGLLSPDHHTNTLFEESRSMALAFPLLVCSSRTPCQAHLCVCEAGSCHNLARSCDVCLKQ